MFSDQRLHLPKTEEEAIARCRANFEAAERALAAKDEVTRFIAKWEKLSDDAKATIEHGARYEFGDDIAVGDVLKRATYGWNGYDRGELRAEAFKVLVQWWEADREQTAKAWVWGDKKHPFIEWAERALTGIVPGPSADMVRDLLEKLGR